jgi:hypothetical protein
MWRGIWRQGAHLPPSWGSIAAPIRSIVPEHGARGVRVTKYGAEVCGQRPARIRSEHGGGLCRRAQRRGEQPGRERPHLRTPDPRPRVGQGVAHIPAACLRSRDGLRTPMTRTIESGSDRKCTRQSGARFGRIRGLSVERNDAMMSWSISRYISPPGCGRSLAHRVTILMRCSAASTLSAALRPCVPHGLRALTPPALRSSPAFARWSRFDRD